MKAFFHKRPLGTYRNWNFWKEKVVFVVEGYLGIRQSRSVKRNLFSERFGTYWMDGWKIGGDGPDPDPERVDLRAMGLTGCE